MKGALSGLHSKDLGRIRKAREERDNLRIEELAEAVENIACAMAALAMTKVDRTRGTSPMVTQYLTDSREWVREALRSFMTPNLRLVEGEGVRQQCAEVPAAERVRCERCGNNTICRDLVCPDWHAAVHKHRHGEEPEALPEDDGPRAA